MEISNFYTVTIYEKGAEVVRMINLLVGAEGFRKGSDLYFDRHDGQAVTTEDFVKAMEDANDVELTQFRNWYSQAGTPELTVSGEYDESAKQYTLNISQSCPDTPGQSNKAAFHIPFRLGLISPDGNEYSLRLSGEDESLASSDRVLDVKKGTEQFVFEGVDAEPVPSLLRSFSAPVKLHYEYTREQLFFLMVHDSDGFNRWNSSQLLAIDIMDQLQQDLADGVELDIPSILIDAYSGVLESALNEPDIDKAMVAHLLSLPVEGFLIERAECADVDRIHRVREFLANALADRLRESFSKIYLANQSEEEFSADASSVARRTLKNLALSYLVRTADDDWLQSCKVQFESATNMTDQLSALRSLTGSGSETASLLKGDALDDFYRQWKHEPLVVDQWFAMQATNQLPGSLDRVNALLTHEDFNIRNPNKVRSLIGAFCGQNHIGFHDSSGSGYKFLADKVLELDKLNPQIAARLLTPLTRWKNFDEKRTAMMIAELNRIKADTSLSKDVFEVVEKSTKV
jgi:aminopeptidase N